MPAPVSRSALFAVLLLLAALLLLAPSSPSSSLARVANGVAAHEHDHSAGGDHDHGADHGDDLGDINFDDAEIAEHDGDDAGEIVDGDDSDMDMELDPEMLHPEAKDGDYAVELEEGSDVDKVAKEANCQNIGNIANIPDHYIFRPLGPNEKEEDIDKLEDQLRGTMGVLSAERQVKRNRAFEKREEL